MTETGLRSGQVADAAGVNLQTLRYYERRGLLDEPQRSPGGHRLYSPEAVTVLRVIKAAQRLGFTLEEISDLLKAGRHRHGQDLDAGLQNRARQKLADVETKIADLTVIATTLRTALDYGCNDLIDCAHSPHCPLPFADLAADRTSGGGLLPLADGPATDREPKGTPSSAASPAAPPTPVPGCNTNPPAAVSPTSTRSTSTLI